MDNVNLKHNIHNRRTIKNKNITSNRNTNTRLSNIFHNNRKNNTPNNKKIKSQLHLAVASFPIERETFSNSFPIERETLYITTFLLNVWIRKR